MVNYERVFKNDSAILAVFLVKPKQVADNRELKHIFYICPHDKTFLAKLDIYEQRMKIIFKGEFEIRVFTDCTPEEQYKIVKEGELIFSSDRERAHYLIDNAVKDYLGVLGAKEVDLKENKKRLKMDEHQGDKTIKRNEKMMLLYFVLVVAILVLVAFIFKGLLLALLIPVVAGLVYFITSKIIMSAAKSVYNGSKSIDKVETYSVARSYVMKMQYDKAVEEYEKAIKEHPSEFEPQYQLADLYYELKDYMKAVNGYEKSLEKAKDREVIAGIKHRLAEIYIYNFKETGKGRALLEQVIKEYKGTKGQERAKALLDRLT